MTPRDGHIRVLPLHVANKIAAGEVVERPASVVKELVENAIDAGAKSIRISITQGGRKLVSVQDDGCGMTRDDAVLSLERQATSKILDVNDIEEIDTLGFRGEAIPSIASVSRFTITTRRHESDEGPLVQVNAGQLAEVRAAGCPPGTLVEVRDLFCNVPALRKFLRAYATEESHVKQVFTVHALAHPAIGFALNVEGRELYRLAPAATLADRVLDLFGRDFVAELLPVGGQPARSASEGIGVPSDNPNNQTSKPSKHQEIRVSGFLERPNLNQPTRRDQYVFVNGRPATAPSIAYALREAYPRRQGDVRPAAILFIDLPPNQVDVNVHPTKREVRFRDNSAVKQAIMSAIEAALRQPPSTRGRPDPALEAPQPDHRDPESGSPPPVPPVPEPPSTRGRPDPVLEAPRPVQVEFAVSPDSTDSRPWQWFTYLAQTAEGYLLIETDAGLVTINPRAARERIVYERLLKASSQDGGKVPSQALLIPETVRMSPADAARIKASLATIAEMGFVIEEFGRDTFKVDAIPQLSENGSPSVMLATIARDLAEGGARRGGARWREELVAKAVARSYAGSSQALTEEGAVRLVEDLCRCRSPYVCPRGKITMILTSNRELNRKFARD